MRSLIHMCIYIYIHKYIYIYIYILGHKILRRFFSSNLVNSKFSYCNTCTSLVRTTICHAMPRYATLLERTSGSANDQTALQALQALRSAPVLALLQIFDRQNGQNLLFRGNTLVWILAAVGRQEMIGNEGIKRYQTPNLDNRISKYPGSVYPVDPVDPNLKDLAELSLQPERCHT